MSERSGRRARKGPPPVDPKKFVHIDRPSNASLRGGIVTGFVLSIGAGAIAASCSLLPFHPEAKILYLVAAVIGGSLGCVLFVRSNLRDGRRRREDFIRCGGDPTGMTDMMFGIMRGKRTETGEWIVPEQGSGDYQGI
ncbi:hypothetical protein [Paenarthrobacter sp. NPDC089316]|uniref:hypothetical protein n=1 Tax=unclassified Paenarthrobacter TaxID=2634190 RepID=UPI0034308994